MKLSSTDYRFFAKPLSVSGYYKMTLRQLKLIVTIATLTACLALPFLMTILRSLYSIRDTSFDSYQRYKMHLIPTRDLIVYSTLGFCLLVSAWTFINFKMGRSISRFDVVAAFIFLITAALIIMIKALLPSGPLV